MVDESQFLRRWEIRSFLDFFFFCTFARVRCFLLFLLAFLLASAVWLTSGFFFLVIF